MIGSLEKWIVECQMEDQERIKIQLAYHNTFGGSTESEGILNNLDKNEYEWYTKLGLEKTVKVHRGICPCCKKIHCLFHLLLAEGLL